MDWHRYESALTSSGLFQGFEPKEREVILNRGPVRSGWYQREELVQRTGEPVRGVGLVLEGNVEISRVSLSGRRSLIANLGQGELFGEGLACAGVAISPVDVWTLGHAVILFLDLPPAAADIVGDPLRARLTNNLLRIMGQKTLMISEQLDILSRGSIRSKLALYLLRRMEAAGSGLFTIPLNRNDLAAYLGVDRSALSRVLSGMASLGVLSYRKNVFEVLDPETLEEWVD